MQPRLSPDAIRPTDAPDPPAPMAALEDLAKALVHDGHHLIVLSDSPSALSRAERSLQACWQALAPQAIVLHFTAREPWAWLSHLNDLVGHTPDRARPPPTGLARQSPEEIAVLHEAELLSPSDMALLQGLSQHLPDWGVRWVLLCQQPPTTDQGATASPRWLSWRISGDPEDQTVPMQRGSESSQPASALNADSAAAPQPAGRWAQSLWWPVLVLVFSVGAWLLISGRISPSELASQLTRQPAASLDTPTESSTAMSTLPSTLPLTPTTTIGTAPETSTSPVLADTPNVTAVAPEASAAAETRASPVSAATAATTPPWPPQSSRPHHPPCPMWRCAARAGWCASRLSTSC